MKNPNTLTHTVAFTDRLKPYRNIHKALRAQMMKTVTTVSLADPSEEAQRLSAAAAVDDLIAACQSHLNHEMTFIHPVLRELEAPEVVAFDGDHASQEGVMARLRALATAVRVADAATAPPSLYELYLELSVFVGHNFEHMAEEETRLTEALWRRLSDEQILEIEGRIVASLPPQEAASGIEWMARSLNHGELTELLQGMMAKMPPPIFEGVLGIVRPCLSSSGFARLSRDLGLTGIEERLVA